eukprot:TRINITY_DN33361_c0_g1_i2.p1 TRINITY_DN33361_c0_g1~~TRINITY_DN33361_c0_g1_i2.p1  ORF type:complete len:379 (-),score=80.20 TRINITY_DN33361_c0_g1_i2:47-1054(-)
MRQRLDWQLDAWLPAEGDASQRLALPSLTQPYYNFVADVHATVSAAGLSLIFSSDGNWNSALRRLLQENFLPRFPSVKDSYLITTSPPISEAQLNSGRVKVGNVMFVDARPHLVCGPLGMVKSLQAGGHLEGEAVAIIKTYGSVILKRNGDSGIQDFWDLAKLPPGRFATSSPAEGGSLENYRSSVLGIATSMPRGRELRPEAAAEEAAAFQSRLFDGALSIGPPMHRSVPHLIATGQADAGLIFLHLAVTAMRENPGVFSAVYLSAGPEQETDDPDVLARGQEPLPGNQVSTLAVSRTSIATNAMQHAAREGLVEALRSEVFTGILKECGLRRP